MISDLDSAQGWGTWDVIGGGLLTDLMKYSRLDDAQASMERLQSALAAVPGGAGGRDGSAHRPLCA